MFGLFGKKKPTGPGQPVPRGRRVNLEKRFTIVAETGQGSMSRVYRAMDNQTGGRVCLKVQDKAKNGRRGRPGHGDAARPRGRSASKIIHPHVVRTFEYGETTKGEHYIVMEFIEGVSLKFIRETPGPKLAEKLELLAQAAEGLAAVHAAGFIHHDVGPEEPAGQPRRPGQADRLRPGRPEHPAVPAAPATGPARCSTWPPS